MMTRWTELDELASWRGRQMSVVLKAIANTHRQHEGQDVITKFFSNVLPTGPAER